MIVVPRSLLLLLLLLPALARAQLPPPLTWSMQATACQPDDGTARRLWRANRDYITLLPGLVTIPRASHWPYTVHCPVTGDGVRLMNHLQVLYKDPDGFGTASRLLVEVRRHRFLPPPSHYPPFYEVLGTFDSNRHAPVPGSDVADRGVLAERFLVGPVTDFATATYTVALRLSRSDLEVPPPWVYSVRLGYRPLPPYRRTGQAPPPE